MIATICAGTDRVPRKSADSATRDGPLPSVPWSGSLYIGFYQDRDTKERVHDRSYRFEVALPRKQVAKLRALLRDACRVFAQKCIYLSVAGYVEFVEGMGHESE